jgi:fumarate hydratase class II
LPRVGYKKAAEVASLMQEKQLDIKQAVEKLKLITNNELEKLLQPSALMSMSTDE